MKQSNLDLENKRIRTAVLSVLLSTMVFSTAFLDPVNWPKQIALFSILPILVYEYLRITKGKTSFSLRKLDSSFIFLISIVMLSVHFIFSNGDLTRKLWGVFGRNNGFVTSISLLIVGLTFSHFHWKDKSIISTLRSINAVTLIAALYGVMQLVDIDPVPWNIKDQVFSFYGNANFASAILSTGSLAAFALLFFSKAAKTERLFYLSSLLLQLFVCYETKSLQGILGFAIGIVLMGLFRLSLKNFKLAVIASLGAGVVGTSLFVGFLGIPILGQDLTQYTLKLRLYYWLAGIQMGLDRPIFGVGIDSYGDYFQRYRKDEVIPLMGVDIFTNNAHNPFVQSFATLGILGLIAICLPFFFALNSCIVILRRKEETINVAFAAIFLTSWLVAFFSIENIAIATINWLLLGIVIGISKSSSDDVKVVATLFNRGRRTSPIMFQPLIRNAAILLCFALSWSASFPCRALSREFSRQISSNDLQAIANRTQNLIKIASGSLAREYEINIAVQGLVAIQKNSEGIEVLSKGTQRFPRDFILLDNLAYREELIGRIKDAVKTREKLLQVESRNPRVWLYYAFVLQKDGQNEKAKSAFLNAVRLENYMDPQTKSLIPELKKKFGIE